MCVNELTETQVAYIAGLIDGEGSVECQRQIQKKGRTFQFVLRLNFTMGTPEPLTTIGRWLDVRVKVYPPTSPERQPRWRLDVTKGKAIPLLERCLPYLLLKAPQAELVLAIERVRATNTPSRSLPMGELRRMPAGAIAEMQELHGQLRALKSAKRPAQLRI